MDCANSNFAHNIYTLIYSDKSVTHSIKTVSCKFYLPNRAVVYSNYAIVSELHFLIIILEA